MHVIENVSQAVEQQDGESNEDHKQRLDNMSYLYCDKCLRSRYMYNSFGKVVVDTIPYYYFGIKSNL